jgi:Tfp pilus assembly protein FimT
MAELVVALSVVAIMGAIAVPMVSSTMRSMRLAGDVRGIAAALGQAKLSSTAQMIQHQVSFDIAGNS